MGLAGLLVLGGMYAVTTFSFHHLVRRSATPPAPGIAWLAVRVPAPARPPAPGPAAIRFDLIGTAGLRFDAVYAGNSETQSVSGVLPGQISFLADSFTTTISVYGPGQFGFQAYRSDRRVAWSDPQPIVNTNTFVIESMGRGRGIRFRQIAGGASAGN
jgi:hypothetical protein